MTPHRIYILNHESQFQQLQPTACILKQDNLAVVQHLNKEYGKAIKQIHYSGAIDRASEIRPVKNQVVKVMLRRKNDLAIAAETLQNKGFYICPQFPVSSPGDISAITSTRLAVDLIYILDTVIPVLAEEILDHYLHAVSLEVPIQPFHAILQAKMNNTHISLWHLNKIYPGLFYYADRMGLSEEPQELAAGNYHYMFSDSGGVPESTGRFSSAQQFLNSIPDQHPGCLACTHFHICTSWAVYKKNSCPMWTAILNTIQKASRNLQRMAGMPEANLDAATSGDDSPSDTR
jgi:hypothetical protein